ncbi:MAG: 23S rRNA (guanosine(2251)-2'-O)-methyltransferase RlmB [Bacteroidales bacterium]|nr:23S rRNA (guanosine(2251)-2'-O)-methyltransferase RlmB [Bacteroidales bacterium]
MHVYDFWRESAELFYVKSEKGIDKIFFQSNLQGKLFLELKALLTQSEKTISVQYVPVEKLDRLVKRQNHQGVVAQLSLIAYREIEEIIEELERENEKPFLLMLDSVTDVRNLGAIARSAECAGVHALIIPQQSTAPINQDAIRTSAGALLRLPVCRVANTKSLLNLVKSYGITTYVATEKATENYTAMNAQEPMMIIMGNEEKGVSPQIIKMADRLVFIPIKGVIESLNVSVAAGVMMYEVVRQRENK